MPSIELDAIFHQPGWTELDEREFKSRVAAAVARPAWVIDGNYRAVRDLVWARADTVVWLDPPRVLATARVIWRTGQRVLTHRELWNGNREHWSQLLSRDPERSIVAWSWSKHGYYRKMYAQAARDPRWEALQFIRVSSRAGRRRLLARATGRS
ncbi:MAG: hypothetical protein ACRDPD_11900 [Streptosporangiaceae bacterium]